MLQVVEEMKLVPLTVRFTAPADDADMDVRAGLKALAM